MPQGRFFPVPSARKKGRILVRPEIREITSSVMRQKASSALKGIFTETRTLPLYRVVGKGIGLFSTCTG